jgi:hypothetical protein
MKIKFLLLVGLLAFQSINAQDFNPTVTIKKTYGQQSINANYLYNPKHTGYRLGYSYYLAKNYALNPNLRYMQGKIDFTEFTSFAFCINNNYSIYNLGNKLYLNLLASANFGNEQLNLSFSNDEISNNFYEFSTGLELEFYLHRRFLIDANFNQVLLSNSKLGSRYYNVECGFKFIF